MGKSIPGRVNRLHKGPEVGMSLTCLRNSQEASVAGAEETRKKSIGDEIKGKMLCMELVSSFKDFCF